MAAFHARSRRRGLRHSGRSRADPGACGSAIARSAKPKVQSAARCRATDACATPSARGHACRATPVSPDCRSAGRGRSSRALRRATDVAHRRTDERDRTRSEKRVMLIARVDRHTHQPELIEGLGEKRGVARLEHHAFQESRGGAGKANCSTWRGQRRVWTPHARAARGRGP
jgi:hypothetical protein